MYLREIEAEETVGAFAVERQIAISSMVRR
jgi:hypothetical protein